MKYGTNDYQVKRIQWKCSLDVESHAFDVCKIDPFEDKAAQSRDDAQNWKQTNFFLAKDRLVMSLNIFWRTFRRQFFDYSLEIYFFIGPEIGLCI